MAIVMPLIEYAFSEAIVHFAGHESECVPCFFLSLFGRLLLLRIRLVFLLVICRTSISIYSHRNRRYTLFVWFLSAVGFLFLVPCAGSSAVVWCVDVVVIVGVVIVSVAVGTYTHIRGCRWICVTDWMVKSHTRFMCVRNTNIYMRNRGSLMPTLAYNRAHTHMTASHRHRTSHCDVLSKHKQRQ